MCKPPVHHQIITLIFFTRGISFGKYTDASLAYRNYSYRRRLIYKIHFSSHVTSLFKIGAFLFRNTGEMETSSLRFRFCSVSSRGTQHFDFKKYVKLYTFYTLQALSYSLNFDKGQIQLVFAVCIFGPWCYVSKWFIFQIHNAESEFLEQSLYRYFVYCVISDCFVDIKCYPCRLLAQFELIKKK